MNVIAIMMVRDEEEIVAYTIEHLLDQGIDRIVVADNRSVDGTRGILNEYAKVAAVTVVDDPVIGYHQSAKMTALAAAHCAHGDWVVPCDADELWHALDGTLLAECLRGCDTDIAIAHPLVMVPTDADDKADLNPFTRTKHRMIAPEQQGKVAFRWAAAGEIDMGNHDVLHVGHRRADGVIGVRHFQYRSLEQVARKVTNGVEAMDATPYSTAICSHWRGLAIMTADQLSEWWDGYRSQQTVYDPAPWRDGCTNQ